MCNVDFPPNVVTSVIGQVPIFFRWQTLLLWEKENSSIFVKINIHFGFLEETKMAQKFKDETS